jgi:hypothetical protein
MARAGWGSSLVYPNSPLDGLSEDQENHGGKPAEILHSAPGVIVAFEDSERHGDIEQVDEQGVSSEARTFSQLGHYSFQF